MKRATERFEQSNRIAAEAILNHRERYPIALIEWAKAYIRMDAVGLAGRYSASEDGGAGESILRNSQDAGR